MEIIRIRLAILSILVLLIQLCSGELETTIKWERCYDDDNTNVAAEMICYAPARCKKPTSKIMKFNKIQLDTDFNLNDGKCNTGIQFKPIGKSKWLVYMQVEEDQLSLAEGVWFEGPSFKFGCKKNEKVAYIEDKLKSDPNRKAADDFTANRIFCSFFITGIGENLESILNAGGISYFKFKTSEEKKYELPASSQLFTEVKALRTCDPYDAKSDSSSSGDALIAHEIDNIDILEKSKYECPAELGDLHVKLSNTKEYVPSTILECKKDEGTYKFFYTPKGGPAPVAIGTGTPFDVLCATKACTKCPEFEKRAGTESPKYTPAVVATGQCIEAKCGAGSKWEDNWEYESVDGKTGITEAKMECKKNPTINSATWHMKYAGGELEVKSAGCSKKFNCATKNPLKFKCPEKMKIGEDCAPPSTSSNRSDIGCESSVMAQIGEDAPVEIKSLLCEESTGTWHGTDEKTTNVSAGSYVFCSVNAGQHQESASTGNVPMVAALGGLFGIIIIIVAVFGVLAIRRYRKYTPSERLQRKRPKAKWYHKIMPEKLVTDDLAQFKEWTQDQFDLVLEQWLKFSIYERYKFAERVGFELGVSSTCTQYFKLFTKVFEVELDYRVWQGLVPVFKLLHAQATDKENNLDTDKRMRKWCVSLCKPILEKVGWEGCNNEWRETAYQRYIIFNLLYYCEDKEFTEKLLAFFDKGQFHGLHSINRQIAWAAAVRDKDQFEAAKLVADVAICDKNAKREVAAKRAKAAMSSSGGGWSKTKSAASDASGKSSKSNKGSAKDKKAVKGGSKEAKSSASKEGSKSNNSNRSNKSNKSKNEGKSKETKSKKGSKETPSGKAKKGDSKESKSDKSGKSGKGKKGGSKEAAKKGKSREKAGAEDVKGDSGKEKTGPASDKDKKKDKSGKSSKEKTKDKTASGKDKKTTSGKDKKDKSGKSSKEKTKDKTASGKDKKEEKSGKEKEKTCPSTKSKSGKSGKDKKGNSSKSSKEKTAADKTMTSAKSMKSTKGNMSKKKKPTKPGYKERKDADGDKLHGDRAQHIFFAIGSSRNKEQIASFIDYYIESKEYDPSNLVYLFAATLEWDDTRSYGLDLFLNMNKKAFIKMPPGDKYHMRILKNFRKYVIGELDLQKMQDHIIHDPNYTVKHYAQIELSLMLKRIHNNITFQPKMIEELDEALKKLGF